MKTLRIVELIKSDAVDCDVTVKGWVRTKRGNKNVAFIALNDGLFAADIRFDAAAADAYLAAAGLFIDTKTGVGLRQQTIL